MKPASVRDETPKPYPRLCSGTHLDVPLSFAGRGGGDCPAQLSGPKEVGNAILFQLTAILPRCCSPSERNMHDEEGRETKARGDVNVAYPRPQRLGARVVQAERRRYQH